MAVIGRDLAATSDRHPWQVAAMFSGAAAPTDSVELDDLKLEQPNAFVGVRLYDAGGAIIPATAGSFKVRVKTFNTMQWEDFKDNEIDATAPKTASYLAGAMAVQVVPTGLAGVERYVVVVTGYPA